MYKKKLFINLSGSLWPFIIKLRMVFLVGFLKMIEIIKESLEISCWDFAFLAWSFFIEKRLSVFTWAKNKFSRWTD